MSAMISDVENNLNLKLKNALNISDVCSNKGTIFEFDDTTDEQSLIEGRITPTPEEASCLEGVTDAKILNISSGVLWEDKSDSLSGSEDDIEPFEKLARNMEDLTGDGGVLKMELEGGVGSDLPERSSVLFHYSAFLEFADEPFDSTVLRDRPQRVRLDKGEGLPWLRVALRSMRRKERSRFLVRPSYGFGQWCALMWPEGLFIPRNQWVVLSGTSVSGRVTHGEEATGIPAGASILYEVTLLDAVDDSAAEDFENLDWDQRRVVPFADKLAAAKAYHQNGTKHFRAGLLTKAKECYRRASWALENAPLKDAEEERQIAEMTFKLHSNLAQVSLDLKEAAQACTQCRIALEIPFNPPDDMKVKLFYRFAKAKMLLNSFPDARKYLLKSQRLRPNSAEISALYEELLKREHKYNAREKDMCRMMFRACTEQSENAAEVTDVNEGVCVRGKMYSQVRSCPGVAAEMEDTLRTQLKNFANDSGRREFVLPPNLSEEERLFVSEVAKCLNVVVKKFYVGSQTLWKAVKDSSIGTFSE